MTGIFLNEWASKEEMIASFEDAFDACDLTDEQKEKYAHVDVLLADYSFEDYDGLAFVLFRSKKDGHLYEVHAGHCSCYGLEDQWDEELCDLESLKVRIYQGTLGTSYGSNTFKDELLQVIAQIEAKD